MSILKLRQLPAAIALAIASSQLHAAGFAVNELSTNGLGRANAGEAAIAEDASVLSHNSAGLTRLKTITITGSITFIEGSVNLGHVGDKDSDNSVTLVQTIPTFYIAAPVNDCLVLGLGGYTDFGFETDYISDFGGLAKANKSDVKAYYLTFSSGYKVTDKLSLGAGVSYIHAKADISSRCVDGPSFCFLVGVSSGDDIMSLSGDDNTFGWNIGVLYEFTKGTRLGISYKSEVNITFEGDMNSDVMIGEITFINPEGLNWNASSSADLDLPAMLELSAYHELTDRLAVHAGVQKTYWSSFHSPVIKIDNSTMAPTTANESWQNVIRYSIGATYKINQAWTVRVGYANDQTPTTNAERTLRLPDADRDLYSVGTSWMLNDAIQIDASYQYLDGRESTINENDQSYTTNISANIFSIGGSYSL